MAFPYDNETIEWKNELIRTWRKMTSEKNELLATGKLKVVRNKYFDFFNIGYIYPDELLSCRASGYSESDKAYLKNARESLYKVWIKLLPMLINSLDDPSEEFEIESMKLLYATVDNLSMQALEELEARRFGRMEQKNGELVVTKEYTSGEDHPTGGINNICSLVQQHYLFRTGLIKDSNGLSIAALESQQNYVEKLMEKVFIVEREIKVKLPKKIENDFMFNIADHLEKLKIYYDKYNKMPMIEWDHAASMLNREVDEKLERLCAIFNVSHSFRKITLPSGKKVTLKLSRAKAIEYIFREFVTHGEDISKIDIANYSSGGRFADLWRTKEDKEVFNYLFTQTKTTVSLKEYGAICPYKTAI